MYDNCRPPSNESILCILQFSPFLTEFTLLSMCILWLVYLPLLSMQIADLPSNIIRGVYSGTISGSLFNNSLINILKCAKDIPAVHYALYSLPVLDLRNWYWNMCDMVNCTTLIKYNICSLAEVQEHILYFIKVVQLTMAHMFQDQFIDKVQKVRIMHHGLQEWL